MPTMAEYRQAREKADELAAKLELATGEPVSDSDRSCMIAVFLSKLTTRTATEAASS
jgi:hypothetical protein